jgi:hypothetical protein
MPIADMYNAAAISASVGGEPNVLNPTPAKMAASTTAPT